MKKVINIFTLQVLFFAVFVSVSADDFKGLKIIIPDKKLRAAVIRSFDAEYITRKSYIDKDDLKIITSLNASSTGIKNLSGIENLTNLRYLDLSYNKIKSLKGVRINRLSKLEKLYLQGNQIKSLEGVDFTGMDKLERLNLDNNKINSLKKVDLSPLTNLKRLDMDKNNISSFKDVNFSGIQNLDYLYLSYNKISSMDGFKKILQNLPGYMDLSVFHNPVTRSKEYYYQKKLIHDITEKKVTIFP